MLLMMGFHTTHLNYSMTEEQMKIGILGAMPEEVRLIKELMVVTKETVIGDRTYYEGNIGDSEVVLTFSRWGKAAAASTTTTLINMFNVEFAIFVGVAGAVNQTLNIGDVVIGNGFYQHDMDARPFFDKFQIPLTSHIVYEPHPEVVSRATQTIRSFLQKMEAYVPKELLAKYSIFKPTAHEGLIASGDKFIANPLAHEDLKYSQGTKQTLAVDMESAPFAQVCTEQNVPYLVFRTISDKADHSAEVNFREFVEVIASHYSVGLIQEYLCSTKAACSA